MADGRDRSLVPTDEAMKIAGFVNRTTFLKCIRARHIQAHRGRKNRKLYSRAKMLELARDRETVEKRRQMGRNGRLDPLNEPATTGEIHAQAFALFETRTPLHEVVKTLKLPAEVVTDLFEKWWRLGQVTEQWLSPKQAPAALPASPPAPAPDAATHPPPSILPTRGVTGERPGETSGLIEQAKHAEAVAQRALGGGR